MRQILKVINSKNNELIRHIACANKAEAMRFRKMLYMTLCCSMRLDVTFSIEALKVKPKKIVQVSAATNDSAIEEIDSNLDERIELLEELLKEIKINIDLRSKE